MVLNFNDLRVKALFATLEELARSYFIGLNFDGAVINPKNRATFILFNYSSLDTKCNKFVYGDCDQHTSTITIYLSTIVSTALDKYYNLKDQMTANAFVETCKFLLFQTILHELSHMNQLMPIVATQEEYLAIIENPNIDRTFALLRGNCKRWCKQYNLYYTPELIDKFIISNYNDTSYKVGALYISR